MPATATTDGVFRLDTNDVVATIQVLRRANVISVAQLPDALLAVLRAKLLPWQMGELAMVALNVSKEMMADARSRADRPEQMFETGSTKAAAVPRPKGERIPTVRTPGWKPEPPQNAPKPRSATRTRPVSEDGDLLCTICGKWLPPSHFRIRTDRIGSGTRRSACSPCHDARNKSRYLNVRAVESLNAVGLTFTIQDGDDAASLSCAACGFKLNVGDDVHTAADTPLSHVKCPGGN